MAVEIASALPRARFDTTLFVHERWGSLLGTFEHRVRAVFANEGTYKRSQLPRLFMKTLQLAKDADIVVGANEGRATFLSMAAAKMLRKPFVAWLHVNWAEFGQLVSWRQRLSLRQCHRADLVVSASEGIAREFAAIAPIEPRKLRTVPNAIPTELIRELAKEPLPLELEPLFRQPVILAIGRLVHEKNHELLIKSHALLRSRGIAHSLVLLGEGPLREQLAATARSLGVEDSVHLIGFQKNPYRFLSRASVLALSSFFEGFALVLAEAFATGTPVVSVDCPSGPGELLDRGRYGVLVEPGCPERLAAGLASVLTDERERTRLAQLARQRSHDYDISVAVDRWAHALESLVH